jgi:hypothetical protein
MLSKYHLCEYDIKSGFPLFLGLILRQWKDLFNRGDDFYNNFANNFPEGTDRKAIKTGFNKELNRFHFFKGDKFNCELKNWMRKFNVDLGLYPLLKYIVKIKGTAFYTLASMEDKVMRLIMRRIYELYPDVKLVRIHDGFVSTIPIPQFNISVNDYKLTLCSETNEWGEFESSCCQDMRLKIDTYNVYMDKYQYHTLPMFNEYTYNEYVHKQKDVSDTHATVGKSTNVSLYEDCNGAVFSREELAVKCSIDLKDKNFNRKAKQSGYNFVSKKPDMVDNVESDYVSLDQLKKIQCAESARIMAEHNAKCYS